MMLLGEVRELEVEPERPQHFRLPFERERPHRGRQLRARSRLTLGASLPRERANSLLLGEQLLPFLLDDDAAEDLAEQADVPPERCVVVGQGRVTAPSLADETSAAYFASTPMS